MSTVILMPIRTPGVKVFHPKPTTVRTTIIMRRNVSSPLRFVSCQISFRLQLPITEKKPLYHSQTDRFQSQLHNVH